MLIVTLGFLNLFCWFVLKTQQNWESAGFLTVLVLYNRNFLYVLAFLCSWGPQWYGMCKVVSYPSWFGAWQVLKDSTIVSLGIWNSHGWWKLRLGSLCNCLTGFIHPSWCRNSSIHSMRSSFLNKSLGETGFFSKRKHGMATSHRSCASIWHKQSGSQLYTCNLRCTWGDHQTFKRKIVG